MLLLRDGDTQSGACPRDGGDFAVSEDMDRYESSEQGRVTSQEAERGTHSDRQSPRAAPLACADAVGQNV